MLEKAVLREMPKQDELALKRLGAQIKLLRTKDGTETGRFFASVRRIDETLLKKPETDLFGRHN